MGRYLANINSEKILKFYPFGNNIFEAVKKASQNSTENLHKITKISDLLTFIKKIFIAHLILPLS